MKQNYTYKMLLICLFITGVIHGSQAQSRYDSVYTEMARSYPETLAVFTDRDLYAVNESILFSALLQSGNIPYHGPGSKVLYVELVNANGTAVTRGKFPMQENRSHGHLSIPSGLLSGTYFLRSYTRWMRNFGPQDFTYIPIRIVNPYSSDAATYSSTKRTNELFPVSPGNRNIIVSPGKKSYKAGEMVDVLISIKENSRIQIDHACITVVPAGTIDTSVLSHLVRLRAEDTETFQFNYLPEIAGTTISGIALEKDSQKPASNARIHFTILGEEPAYFVSQTDQAGRFQIKTPIRTGDQEMFVVPDHQPDITFEVHIDNEFSTESLPFRPAPFNMKKEEMILASRLALHMQLQEAFFEDSIIINETLNHKPGPLAFYGEPEISIKMDEFIDLPNLEEVIDNLIPNTYVIRRGADRYLTIESENPMISHFSPLILIDHIPVFDMEVIMAIPPSKIDRIEIVPDVYILGEIKFGGIISITSRRMDLASIKLPEGSYFFDYKAYQPPLVPKVARYQGQGKIPDTRNTLFWKEHVEFSRDNSQEFSFRTVSFPGTYLILIRGISSNGEIEYGLDYFNVN